MIQSFIPGARKSIKEWPENEHPRERLYGQQMKYNILFLKWTASDIPVVLPWGQRANMMKKINLALRLPA